MRFLARGTTVIVRSVCVLDGDTLTVRSRALYTWTLYLCTVVVVRVADDRALAGGGHDQTGAAAKIAGNSHNCKYRDM